ncbi:hypothetical protein [Stieleria mannarensis]|uniref:hypothetical protein n=1 Tax=Stieleria mannarensis TaxID=2755585 RepID=UPI0015FF14E5|nr:hypothetical protein [Rhodopirellula sp. JC639]
MDYFAGNWRGVGKQGTYQYTGRETAEWDLHHTILTHRNEFFGANFANTLLMVRMLDPGDQATIRENQFASWGVTRTAQYDVIPYGEWFQLVGTCTQIGKNGTRRTINVVTVHDQNHYTFAVVPMQDAPGTPLRESYSREGVAPYEMSADQTGEYLQAAIDFFESHPEADHTKLVDLKGSHSRWLLQQKRYLESVEVLESLQKALTDQTSIDENAIEKTTDAILSVCRDCAYNACMDTETPEEDLRVALNLARKASELSPEDPRIWLQAFVHYRLADHQAA